MRETRDVRLRRQALFLIPVTDVWRARETARRGDRDAAIPVMREAVGELRQGYPYYGVWGTQVLVETLLERGTPADLAEAHQAFDWIASLAAEDDSAMLAIALLRLRALLARACGDEAAFCDLVSRYRAMTQSLGFEGHIEWAEAIVDGPQDPKKR